jgi:uncharacterized protein
MAKVNIRYIISRCVGDKSIKILDYFLKSKEFLSFNERENFWYDNSLIYAIKDNEEKIAELLAHKKIGIYAIDDFDTTPLIWASSKGFVHITEFLVKIGGEVNRRNFKGRTALMYASLLGRTEIVKILLKNGDYINEKDDNLQTALDLAIGHNHKDIIEILQKAGAE